ncbi:MAG TPA: hypothetical protein VNQ77_10125 [Frankiaceae bacterium]|nr:hypothetical protein [Frankiaceae bacterium]
MALFGRKAPAVEVDDLLRHPPAHAAAVAAAAGDVAAVGAVLGTATGESRTLVVDGVARNLSLPAAAGWTDAEPGRADAWLARAATEAWLAAEARGAGRAKTLSTGQRLDFAQLMSDARRSASRAAELAPADPEPLHVLIKTCYALGPDDLEGLFAELRRRDPWHLYGLGTTVDLLAEKWYGEGDEARALADDLAAAAPEGSLVPVVVAAAMREQWYYLAVFRKERDAAIGFVAMPETRAALDAARGRSVGSPAYQPSPMAPWAANTFAYTFYNFGRHADAAALLAPLDGLCTSHPWAMSGDPAATYAKALKGK